MSKSVPPVSEADLVGWRAALKASKTILGWPEWSDVESVPANRRADPPKRTALNTVSTEQTFTLFQLGDEHGTGLVGVRLRLSAWGYHHQRDVTATLEVIGGRSFVTISRVDAWPSDPHHNSYKALKRWGLKGYPGEVAGCHVHRFDDNVKYGPEAFGAGPEGNLPVAVAFPKGLQSFREFLRSVGTEFNIGGIDEFPSPPSWQGLF